MKKFDYCLLAFAFVCSLLLSFDVSAQPTRSYDFEMEPDCIWNKSTAQCVLQNKLPITITCQVTVSGKTFRGVKLGNTRTVIVPAKSVDSSTRIYVAEGDVLTYAAAWADCRTE